jgi:hypothetical protein
MSVSTAIAPGTDIRDLFQAAYNNRYTWEPGFSGYSGRCLWIQGERQVEGSFNVGADFKAEVNGVSDEEVHKAFASQLWEVCIHRVRRSFEQTHSANTFTAGDNTAEGLEVIVGGKGEGDKYRIKNDVVTMVHRHIHGTVVTIHTESTTDTGSGYLSRSYTSQYADPTSGETKGGVNHFTDTFAPLVEGGPWVLSEREIRTEAFGDTPESLQTFRFVDLKAA